MGVFDSTFSSRRRPFRPLLTSILTFPRTLFTRLPHLSTYPHPPLYCRTLHFHMGTLSFHFFSSSNPTMRPQLLLVSTYAYVISPASRQASHRTVSDRCAKPVTPFQSLYSPCHILINRVPHYHEKEGLAPLKLNSHFFSVQKLTVVVSENSSSFHNYLKPVFVFFILYASVVFPIRAKVFPLYYIPVY